MKKILLIIPLVFCFIINSLVAVSVFAVSGDSETGETNTPLENDYVTELDEEASHLNFFPFDAMQSMYNRKYYLYFTGYDLKSGSGNYQSSNFNGDFTIIRRGQDKLSSGTAYNHASESSLDKKKL